MRRAGIALALLLAAAPAVLAQPAPGGPEGRPRRSYADPSAVIAADLALSRVAREKGQWRALRDAAGPGAVVFAPRPFDAAAWLKRRPEPTTPTRWQPRAVWISCDGGHAVSRGQWSRGTESGDYVAVWERQKKGEWKWLVHDEGPAAELGEAPEMIAAQVAECSGLRRRPGEGAVLRDAADAASDDRSLKWRVTLGPDCARVLSVEVWDGRALVPVFTVRRGAPAGGCG